MSVESCDFKRLDADERGAVALSGKGISWGLAKRWHRSYDSCSYLQLCAMYVMYKKFMRLLRQQCLKQRGHAVTSSRHAPGAFPKMKISEIHELTHEYHFFVNFC